RLELLPYYLLNIFLNTAALLPLSSNKFVFVDPFPITCPLEPSKDHLKFFRTLFEPDIHIDHEFYREEFLDEIFLYKYLHIYILFLLSQIMAIVPFENRQLI